MKWSRYLKMRFSFFLKDMTLTLLSLEDGVARNVYFPICVLLPRKRKTLGASPMIWLTTIKVLSMRKKLGGL